MKKFVTWLGVGLLTSAFLDPVIYASLEKPVPWFRDLFMAAAGVGCIYLLVKFHREW